MDQGILYVEHLPQRCHEFIKQVGCWQCVVIGNVAYSPYASIGGCRRNGVRGLIMVRSLGAGISVWTAELRQHNILTAFLMPNLCDEHTTHVAREHREHQSLLKETVMCPIA
jgi:hypothetical protein